MVGRRFVGFSIVGVVVLGLGMMLLAFLVEVMSIDEIVAGVATTVFSLETNFVLNKYLNWRDREGRWTRQWWRYHLTRMGAVVINQSLYTVLVLFGANYLLTTIVLTV